jgi:predicted DsbA family dithiol-disulfide isomerase
MVEDKLNKKGIEYKEINDKAIMHSMGINKVPVLVVNGSMYSNILEIKNKIAEM